MCPLVTLARRKVHLVLEDEARDQGLRFHVSPKRRFHVNMRKLLNPSGNVEKHRSRGID